VSSSKVNATGAVEFDSQLRREVIQWTQLRPGQPWVVALSGGAHSAALLKIVASVRSESFSVRALHVHHGFEHSDRLAQAAQAVAAAVGVPITVVSVAIDATSNLEEAAREARYDAFVAQLQPGELLALAHHRADQAETFLLRLLRGAGVDGLMAMAEQRPCGRGELIRPWLRCDESVVREAAGGLPYWEDPMNAQTQFDRVYIRRQLMPLLQHRWPAATTLIDRAARHLRDRFEPPSLRLGVGASRVLPADPLRALARVERFDSIRAVLKQLRFKAPSQQQCFEFDRMLFAGLQSRRACVRLGNAEVRLANDQLYVGPPLADLSLQHSVDLTSGACALGELGCVVFSATTASDAARWAIGPARGSPPLAMADFQGRHSATQWLKRFGYPHWVRDRALLLWRDEEVVAIVLASKTVWVSPVYSARVAVEWRHAPIWLTDQP